ncbi:armadillo-type protein [Mycena alexandri]|uniref:Vacuolar protein 8 n=1 Tax=Mycena alexandri TaxID=1745969 RepID=A0AAD6WMA8_9AGAR|nr:armadillo-type protein [Mycena alexandri]
MLSDRFLIRSPGWPVSGNAPSGRSLTLRCSELRLLVDTPNSQFALPKRYPSSIPYPVCAVFCLDLSWRQGHCISPGTCYNHKTRHCGKMGAGPSLNLHSPSREAVLAVRPCARLATLLRDGNVNVVHGAVYALSQIVRDLDGAKAVVEAGVLAFLEQLLKSQDTGVRNAGCWLLARLAFHSSTREAVVAIQPCVFNRTFKVSDGIDNVDVVQGACCALSEISRDLGSASAAVEAGVLDFISEMLESKNVMVRKSTSWLLARLAFHSSTRGAVIAVQPCARLVALLGACYALSQLSLDLDGATAVVEAGALRLLVHLLESQNMEVRRYTCWAFGSLAVRSSTRGAVLAVQPCVQLVAFLGRSLGTAMWILSKACYALSQIARDLDGARAVEQAGVLDFIPELLESQDTGVREHSCWTLAWLASHSLMRGAVIAVQPCALLVTLFGISPFQPVFSDGNVEVVQGACYALLQISRDPDGAKALGTLNFVTELIESPQVDVRNYTCVLLAHLARYNRLPAPREVSFRKYVRQCVLATTMPFSLISGLAQSPAKEPADTEERVRSSREASHANTCTSVNKSARRENTREDQEIHCTLRGSRSPHWIPGFEASWQDGVVGKHHWISSISEVCGCVKNDGRLIRAPPRSLCFLTTTRCTGDLQFGRAREPTGARGNKAREKDGGVRRERNLGQAKLPSAHAYKRGQERTTGTQITIQELKWRVPIEPKCAAPRPNACDEIETKRLVVL